jgi:hypothetical protein
MEMLDSAYMLELKNTLEQLVNEHGLPVVTRGMVQIWVERQLELMWRHNAAH